MPLNKESKPNYDKQDMLGNVGEIRTNSSSTFSYGLLRMDTLVLADWQKLIFINS